jgi:hypothetical protein
MSIEREIIKADEELQKDLKDLQKELFNASIDFIVDFREAGGVLKLDKKKLASLQSKVDKVIASSKYQKNIEKYLDKYDLIDKLNTEWYAENKLRIDRVIADSEILKEIKLQTFDNLLSKEAIDVNLVKPIVQQLRKDIILGSTYESAKQNLQTLVVDNELINRYAGQIATDALNQYDGELNNQVKEKFNLTKFYYIGSEIETSRPFCRHMKEKKEWTIDELKVALKEYCPNGIPSEKTETIETTDAKGKSVKRSVKKGGGMIEGTNVDNFSMLRGGYQCRHRVQWIK